MHDILLKNPQEKSLKNNPKPTYLQILDRTRVTLKRRLLYQFNISYGVQLTRFRCIFAVRVADGKRIPHCFRTYKKPDRTRDDEPELSPTLSITDAVVAATAAEGLFEEAFLSNGEQQVKFMDILYPLGLIDPMNLIFQELKSLPHPDPISQLISVGSGNVAYDDIGHLLQLGVPKSPLNSTITALNRFLQATRSALWAYERSGAVHIETMCDNPVYAHPQTVAAHLSDQYRETIRELPLEVYRRFDIKPVPDVGPNDFLSLKELGEATHEYLNLIQLQSSKSYLRRGNLEALCWAVRTHNDVVVSELIRRFKWDLGRYYASDLLAAVQNKHQGVAMVLELMNSGNDFQDFFFYLREKDWEQLLKIDSNLTSITDIGCEVGGERKTLLELAARKGYAKLMRLLLHRSMCDHKMDIDVTNAGGYTLLFEAIAGNQIETTKILLRHGANPNATVNGDSVLHTVSGRGSEEIVQELLNHGANINAKSKNGSTALHIASLEGNGEVVNKLLRNGAYVGAKDGDGQPALHLAIKRQKAGVVQILIFIGNADITEEIKGKTAFDIARKLPGGPSKVDITRALHRRSRDQQSTPIEPRPTS